jgi:hypothetical protein
VIAGWNLGIDGNYPWSSMFSYVWDIFWVWFSVYEIYCRYACWRQKEANYPSLPVVSIWHVHFSSSTGI